MRGLFLAALFQAACSMTFDGSAAEIPLVGPEPTTGALPKLNVYPAQSNASIVYGFQGDFWLTWLEDVPSATDPDTLERSRRAVRLKDTTQQELFSNVQIQFGYRDWWFTKVDPSTVTNPQTHLTIRGLGETDGGDSFDLPGTGLLGIGTNDRLFYYWQNDPNTTAITVQRRGPTYFSRQIPLPNGVDPTSPPGPLQIFFSPDGNGLFIRDQVGNLTMYSTVNATDQKSYGVRPSSILIDGARNSLLTCGDDGLREVPIDGSPDKVLDPDPCGPSPGYTFYGIRAYYLTKDGQFRRVMLDGSTAPENVVLPGLRLIGFGPKESFVVANDPEDTYVNDASDGIWNGWQFMNRGIDWAFSSTQKRMRWTENAAKIGAIGDLMAVDVPTDGQTTTAPPLRLSLNVRAWEELSDHRLLVVENRAFKGDFNRLVVVDETRMEKRWVAAEATDYLHIPGTNNCLIQRWAPTGVDMVIVPIPPAVTD
jgi:hypothetical protein